MSLENIAYTCFGNNLVVGKHIKKQLAFLGSILPAELIGRDVDDLGCGDGKVTVLLKNLLQPSRLRGFDLHQGNVRRAISRGIDASSVDLDNHLPKGELAVMWGVLHHLDDPERCVNKLKENYPLLLIREPIRTGAVKGWELGNPMRLKELISVFDNCLPGHRIHHFGSSIIVLYGCRDYVKKAYAPATRNELIPAASLKLYREALPDNQEISRSL